MLIYLCLSCTGVCYMALSTSIIIALACYIVVEAIFRCLGAPWAKLLNVYKKIYKKFPFNMLKYLILGLLIFLFYNVTMEVETWMLRSNSLFSCYDFKLYGYCFFDFISMVREKNNPNTPI